MCGDSGCAGCRESRKATLKPDSCTDPILKCASEGGRRRAVIQMSDTNTNTEHCFSVSESAWFGCASVDINPRGCK